MWNVNPGLNINNEVKRIEISKDIGLALLSKVIGVQSIESKFQAYLERLKKTRSLVDLGPRLNSQLKIQNEVGKIYASSDADVSKMYWKSKKKIYGIDNEIHLIE